MNNIHAWNVSPKEAIEIQKDLKDRIILEPFKHQISTIAGVDVSMNRFSNVLYAGVVVLMYPEMTILDHAVIKVDTEFPYIPGLLSFREIPGLMKCFDQLLIVPDVIVVDGQGIAHPRRLGIATHLGILLNIPTIGCAKSKLYGVGDEPKKAGESIPLRDPKTNEILGMRQRVKERAKPMIISPGHLMDTESAMKIMKPCFQGYRMPEPTRQAHLLVNAYRKECKEQIVSRLDNYDNMARSSK